MVLLSDCTAGYSKAERPSLPVFGAAGSNGNRRAPAPALRASARMRKRMRLHLAALAITLLLALAPAVSSQEAAPQNGVDEEMLKQIDMMIRTMQIIRKNYVDIDKVSTAELFQGAMQGMVRKLDPYSVFMEPTELKNFKEGMEGEFGGIGINMQVKDGKVIVLAVFSGTPAEKAGFKAGDMITAVDGALITREDLDNMLKRLRGPVGSKVRVTLLRPGEDNRSFEVEMERAIIETPSVVDAKVVDGTSIGYVRLLQFQEHTARDLEKVLRDFEGKKVSAIIMDLRGNPGGLLGTAIEVCSMFLPERKLVVTVRHHSDLHENRESERFQEHFTKGGYKVPDNVGLMLLVDRNSASASEITAGCLRDYGRAVLLGTRTFGKGSVQNVIELGDGNAIKLTIARYYTPDPKRPTIDKNGVSPDITEEMSPAELSAVMTGVNRPDIERDRQFARAVQVLKSLSVLSRK